MSRICNIIGKIGLIIFTLYISIVNTGYANAKIIFQDDTVGTYESETLKIGSNDAGVNNTAIQFGADPTGTENGNIAWNIGSNTFGVDHTLSITGGLSATGTIDFSTGSRFAKPQGASNPGTCTVGDEFFNTTDKFNYACTTTNVWTKVGAGTVDFENVYATDADKILTTSNGAFTIAAGSGAVGITSTGGINLNASTNGVVNIGTGTTTSTVSIGGGSNNVAIDSSTWDISGAGVASGLTGITSANGTISLNDSSGTNTTSIGGGTTTGSVTIGGTGAQTVAIGNGAGAKTVNVGSNNTTSTTTILSGSGGVLINDANNQPTTINGGTSTGAVSIASGAGTQTVSLGDGSTGVKTVTLGSTNTTSTTNISSGSGGVNLNANNNQPTNIGTGTTTGTVTVGGTGTQIIAVGNGAGNKTMNLGSNNDGSTTTILSGTGNLTINATAGAATTGIGTGTTTGTVSIGGNADQVAVDSSTWDISGAGLASGLTGITSTGNIVFTGATSFRPPQAAAAPGTCNVGQIYYNTTTNDFWDCTTTNTWTVMVDISSLGTAGQILRSNATSTPAWSTATYPATAGTAGNILRSDGTNFVSTAVTTGQSTPANPTGTTSTTGVMMGLAGSVTPVRSGTILIIISGDIANNTNNNGAQVQIRFGTGAAPANGVALTGTAVGGIPKINEARAAAPVPFTTNAIVTGLTVGTAVWIDLSLAAVTGGNASIADISISAIEL